MPHLPRLALLLLVVGLASCAVHRQSVQTSEWTYVETATEPVARHEAAFVSVGDRYYLLGGRGIRPVSIYDKSTSEWTEGAPPPVEIHHFQPVVYRGEVYLLGAMTGGYPGETPLPHVYIYNPDRDEWRRGHEIPEDRRRGGAGAVEHDGRIYLICGIRDGHRGDHKTWLDVYDPTTGDWERLPDAPRPRDHFQAAVVDGKIYAAAGRTTVAATNPFANTIGAVDVYDTETRRWITLPNELPTRRAGTAAIAVDKRVVVIGGESDTQEPAHAEVEALDVASGDWTALPPLVRGRHGTGAIHHDGSLIMASGCGMRGGEPELADMIRARVE
ncbi:kelch-like protein [Lewinella sp. JB7]|uniref:Kelch repeat-containing protein n=1 Tax=Lewinella sp. JB7 TaxID=2962887 RepID=UPI0020C997FE|nr:kelch-like protein [Lewinella sp. JB7]MCP9234983.1 galactose oxidase [Lewinella sp. JB7]